MKNIALLLLFSYQIFLFSLADTLLIEEINKTSDVIKPTRGMTMSQVLTKFGEPLEKKDAIGEPPIIQWFYSDFIVYFERQGVIQAVIIKQKNSNLNQSQL